MGKQEYGFLTGEGDAWLQRNTGKIGGHSAVLEALCALGKELEGIVLEVGCSNGWQLAQIADRFVACSCYGIEPSDQAVLEAGRHFPHIEVEPGVASTLHDYHTNCVGLLIYGFCLYLTDRDKLHTIVSEGHRVLAEQGHLVIHDFDPEYPHRVEYHHQPGFYSYKMDYAALFLANPAYRLVLKTKPDAETAVWILQKDTAAGWAKEPPTKGPST